ARARLPDMSRLRASSDNSGSLALAADGRPERFDLAIALDDPEGAAVLLPLSGPETRIATADFRARFDRSRGDTWDAAGTVGQLSRSGFTMERAIFDAKGVIDRTGPAAVDARVATTLFGLSHTDRRLSSALGTKVELTGEIGWTAGGAVELGAVTVVTQTATAHVEGTLVATNGDLTLAGRMDLSSDDLSVFAGMAGRALSGQAELRLEGRGRVLGGMFDMALQGDTVDLAIGASRFDPLFAGPATIDLSIERDRTGTRIRAATLTTRTLDISGSADLQTTTGVFDLSARLKDVARFVPVLRGPVAMTVAGTGEDRVWTIESNLNGPGTLRTTATARIPLDGEIRARVGATIDTLQSVIPELPGAADATVDIRQADGGWRIEALVNGPGGIRATVDGDVTAKAGTAALGITGTAPLALANRALAPRSLTGEAMFDLRLEGPFALSSLRGTATIDDARLSLPTLRNAMEDITGRITLTDGLAAYTLSSSLLLGGNVSASGNSALTFPYASDVDLRIGNAAVGDSRLYSSRIDGLIRLLGPLAGGARITGDIVLDETQIQIPSTGFVTGDAADIVRHVEEPRPVHRTRVRAGLVRPDRAANTAAFPMDILLRAPNRIFIRGRGLDAELGGRLRLGGTTANVVPSGQLSLLRGSLDILGKRLTLEEGMAQMQGDFVSVVRLVARSEADGVIVRIIVSGPVSQPDIVFTSVPELPEDEVLSRLLFGRGLAGLSPLQAVQITSAVATLAGRGGAGLIGSLRQSFGLDALDIETDEAGRARLRVGEYISDNLYTDVTVDGQGTSAIHLRLDVSPNVTIKGRAGADGDTGIGLFFERDY
ncbi:MAG: translocation/assembly module TamB domain-containing protein, partial [Pseudomonadota bacterium]